MNQNKAFSNYFKIIVVSYCTLLVFRLFETVSIIWSFGYSDSLISSEIIGLIYDYLIINIFLLGFYPLYYLLHRKAEGLANSVFLSGIILLAILHLILLKYFFYQLDPLDISLYQYSLNEIFFTLNTTNTGYLKIIVSGLVLLTIVFASFRLSRKTRFLKKTIQIGSLLIVLSLPLFILTQLFFADGFNKYSRNKSFYFYSQSLSYFLISEKINQNYSLQDSRDFQVLYPSKNYTGTDYPLIHKFDSINPLGPLFEKSDQAPNIVILIVEGLSDDFIHNYKGVDLMPFLSKLKDKSLYWDRCFTLGERSFAIVPSILGSLPYGEKGFTLLDDLPYHMSLISILNANDYYTSFFYGQGSWFHRKDRFFMYNKIDLIFDNKKFSDKYEKIIVGEDKFFWGYNDKDLFNQSFEALDTISAKHRLDIYFTGTSHSPFFISNEDYYEKYFSGVSGKITNQEDVDFFMTYKKYIKSIFFVDDALEDFFIKYQKRDDYRNTIFIITGDHPMTEIPIANSLKRYHVPLIIFSEKLIKPQTFSNTISHLDIYESILSFLKPYGIDIPPVSTALGDKLLPGINSEVKHLAFMNGNREIIDFYSGNYFISGKQTFRVDQNLNLTKIKDINIWEKVNRELNTFKKTSLYACNENKILPDSDYCKYLNYPIIYTSKISDTIKSDNEFQNLFPTLNVKNQDFTYDIEFNFTSETDDISLVYQLNGQKDSVLLWNNIGMTNAGKTFKSHIKIPFQKNADSILHFKSYFWNPTKAEFKYSQLDISIYGE